jgi:hypothetical protein
MGDSIEELLSWRLSDERHNSEYWDFEYRISRHFLNVKDEDLARRYGAICRNISFLISDLRDQIPIQAYFHSTWWWLRKRQQMLTEYSLRGCEPPQYEINSPMFNFPAAPFTLARPDEYKMLVRYGEAQWLVPLATRGRVRFTPASHYKNEELDPARYDDELTHSTFSRGDRVTITMQDGTRTPIIGDLKTTVNSKSDMYVFCVGSEFDARLFAEFPNDLGSPADAYCVIWDTEEFYRRLLVGTERTFPGWTFHHLPILYFDPYENGRNVISPGISKKLNYAYQREYRFIWFPPRREFLSHSLDFTIGALTDLITVFNRDGSILAGSKSRFAA